VELNAVVTQMRVVRLMQLPYIPYMWMLYNYKYVFTHTLAHTLQNPNHNPNSKLYHRTPTLIAALSHNSNPSLNSASVDVNVRLRFRLTPSINLKP